MTTVRFGWWRTAFVTGWFGLLCVFLPAVVVHLDRYPVVWFDEGYKMNAARTLADHGVYGTYSVDGYVPFDPGIASGPADVVPVAASFRLFGAGVTQARSVYLLYTWLATVALYWLAAVIFGHRAALLAATAVLAAPPVAGTGLFLIGRQALGEAPSLALILSGCLLWVRGWGRAGPAHHVAAGLLLGLGLLSKTQVALPLLPALVVVAVGRGWPDWRRLARELMPAAVAVGIVAAWALVGREFTSQAQQQANSVLLSDAIRSNLLTGLWGRSLSRTAFGLTGIMLTASAVGAWRLWRSDPASRDTAGWWAELFLVTLVAFYAVWFALLSVGWPRYAFFGLVAALLLLAGAAAHALDRERPQRRLLQGFAWVVVGFALAGQVLLAREGTRPDRATEVAAYLDREVGPAAVVETWEWELSVLTRHRAFHYPNQSYLFLAIRQRSHDQQAFALHYDALQADPDYLVVGIFGAWTGIYSPATLARDFSLVRQIGDYRIYRRLRVGGTASRLASAAD